MADALCVLDERVSRLDAKPEHIDTSGLLDPDITHFIRTMKGVTPPGNPVERNLLPASVPEVADDMVGRCHLLRRLIIKVPEVAIGPVNRAAQYWIATGRRSYLPRRAATLDRSHFVAASRATHSGTAKPVALGLYTSTGFLDTWGMWWAFLELNRGSTLFPFPWHVWSLKVREEAKILDISSAADWVTFVLTYPVPRQSLIYPDWTRVAERWDGIHVTIRAIAAIQGIRFSVGARFIAAPYWDVESTLWLRWLVTEARRVAVVSN